MEAFKIRLFKLSKNRTLMYGVPFFVLIIGGSFGLKEFTQIRYQFSKKSAIKPEDFEKYGIKMKKPGEVTLESEYEKIKDLASQDWEQKRGPRPWEME